MVEKWPKLALMRIGYGYRRSDKEFAAWDCERVWIDTPKTQRLERRDMFLAFRAGDTLFMLGKGDLGYGKELQALRERLTEKGVTVEYPSYEPGRRGRPSGFAPDPEQDERIKIMWRDVTFSQAYVLRRASEIMGADIKRHQLIYRYGKRNI